MARRVQVNLGGEGEEAGAVNQQGVWILAPDWTSSREGKSLAMLRAEGNLFVIADNRFLPFASASIDEVFTNGVPIDGDDTWLGAPVQSSEAKRILKPGGKWFRDGILYYQKP